MDKFKIWQKWFWIGIVISILSPFGGVIYAIALALEPPHRTEGLIIGIIAMIMGTLFLSMVPVSPTL